jgi:hypothetical protein
MYLHRHGEERSDAAIWSTSYVTGAIPTMDGTLDPLVV